LLRRHLVCARAARVRAAGRAGAGDGRDRRLARGPGRRRPRRRGARRALVAGADAVSGRGALALVTGGAGFVGTNLVERLLADGKRVRVLDSLGRRGSERNLRWLRARYRDRVEVELGDLRDETAVRRAVVGVSEVYHLAAQVAVTTSLEDPFDDFLVNAQGTVRLLNELRRLTEPPFVLFTSTNKVYGSLPDAELVRVHDRWRPADELLAQRGVGEQRPLDFCTPYGCSKGAADQYVLDWGKSYGIPTTVFR